MRTRAIWKSAGQRLYTPAGGDLESLQASIIRSQLTGEGRFDVILTEAGFEHFKYPHLAAHEIMKALRVGGLVFVQSHQTFPIHAVPYDYFRFSTDALRSLFGAAMGMKIHAANYASPAAIYSRVDPQGRTIGDSAILLTMNRLSPTGGVDKPIIRLRQHLGQAFGGQDPSRGRGRAEHEGEHARLLHCFEHQLRQLAPRPLRLRHRLHRPCAANDRTDRRGPAWPE